MTVLPDKIERDLSGRHPNAASVLPDGPELTTGLRKLLEAKDCFVRAAIDAQRKAAGQ